MESLGLHLLMDVIIEPMSIYVSTTFEVGLIDNVERILHQR